MLTTKQQIDQFLRSPQIAIAGVSANPKKFGNQVFSMLFKKGYNVFPINPNHAEINGIPCLKDLHELPQSVDSILILTPKYQTDIILEKALNRKIPNIWVQQQSETKDSMKIAEKHGQNVIFKKCIFMFAEPVSGVHNFHRFLSKLVGKYPN